MRTTGIVLIILGILALVYSGINYTTEKKVVDIGKLEINKEQRRSINWPPVTGVLLLVGGIVVLMTDKKK
jgi:uncharacterized membrane protein YidH (DUF202 family)